LSNLDLFSVSKETVIITGASGQLGLVYQKAFLREGSNVVGIDINKSQEIDDLKNEFKNKYLFLNGDITSKSSLEKCLKDIKQKFEDPSVLINNAALDSPPGSGHEETGPFEAYPEKSWDKVLDVNLKGTFLTCQIFGAEMASIGRGSIINISSIYGMVSPDQNIYNYKKKNGEVFYKPVAYSASKSGVMNLTRYLATYWARSNVRVNTVSLAGVFNDQEEEFLESYCSRIPIGRMAKENEYIGAIMFLSSDASTYMTGSNLVIDGGWTSI